MSIAIDPDTKVADLLISYPETAAVFAANGMEALVSEDGRRVLAPFLTLGTALRSRSIAPESFLRLLVEAASGGALLDAPGLADIRRQGDLRLLALLPCGLKVPFGRAISAFLEELPKEGGPKIRYAVEGNLNQELSYYPYISRIEAASELPDIIVSADFNAFYYHDFQKRFVDTGDFAAPVELETTGSFQAAGIIDPLRQYFVFGINPLVIVADLDRLEGRPLPECWRDLQDPVWKRSICLRGNADFFCHAVLLPIFQEHGAQGLRRLGPNVRQGLHPAQMVKQIDAGGEAALYVMPEFFAHRVKNRERIRILWPEDGALASPVTLQVKKSRAAELQPVLDYLCGPEMAKVLSGARFPVPHAAVEGPLQGRPLKWLGWDYMRKNDIAALNREIDAVFVPAVGGIFE